MVDAQDVPERAVDIPRDEDDAAAADRAQVELSRTSVCVTRGYTSSIGRSGYDGMSVSGEGKISVGFTPIRNTPLMIRGVSSSPSRIG